MFFQQAGPLQIRHQLEFIVIQNIPLHWKQRRHPSAFIWLKICLPGLKRLTVIGRNLLDVLLRSLKNIWRNEITINFRLRRER